MFQKLQINTTPKSADRRMSSEKTVNILCSRVLSSWIFMSFDAHLLRSYEQSFDLCYNWIRMEVILQQHWNRVQNILFWMVYNHLLLKCLLGRETFCTEQYSTGTTAVVDTSGNAPSGTVCPLLLSNCESKCNKYWLLMSFYRLWIIRKYLQTWNPILVE